MKRLEIFPWNDRFNTGILDIDEQHRRLVDLVNTLVSHMAFEESSIAISTILDELKRYAEFHFRSEEAIWEEVFENDSWAADHEQSHQRFVDDVFQMEAEAQSTLSSSQDMMKTISRFLTHWLAFHILEQDNRMAKAVHAVRSGSSLQHAKATASEQMAGPTRVMIDTVMFMYDCLAERTLQLTGEVNRRLAAERRLIAANSELRARADIIEDRNAQLNAMFNLSPDGFVAFSRDGRVKFVNPAFQTMTGIAPEEILGKGEDLLVFSLTERCDSPQPGTGIESILPGPNEEPMLRTIILNNPHRVVLQVVGIASDSNSISRIVYFRDVTHESAIDEMKSEFLTTAAHELRNPMASIYGFSEVLMTQDIEPVVRQEITEIIHNQSEVMVSILNELLDLARIEARQGKDFHVQRVCVQDLLDAVICGHHIPSNRSSPTLTYPDERVHIHADREKLAQAVTNVLINAYKYSPRGGEVEVSVELQPFLHDDSGLPQPMVAISVSDHGIGMSPDQVAHVGERFYRANRSSAISGTGLGMSIVKEILALHGGRIAIYSSLDAGTTVTLLIPVIPAER